MFDEHINKIYALGTTASFTGFAISHASINEWLQTISLLLGIITGVIAVVTFITKNTRKK
jgi:hypothetical protein